ncbi:tetratricopeptide repeat protein [Histidinibacterium aquaticum]|uniref:Tetratricopeptide repeat protein n=1 Tax=Histidinibacterium aquaticum TaxID=2613962 RepID=A0A5J5GEZ1_9RHOB|nr:tetratricopeptide repeat protein [Histidinibacterium aquaticum]KAA9006735.1 tetratricopeptide repeat protein [Histidinibacterium aquaticum]
MTVRELRRTAAAAHRAGELDRARALYARYLADQPGDAAIWSNLGVLHRSEKRPEQAVRAHARAHALDPEGTGVLNNYANALTDIGRYTDAIGLREQLLEETPGDTQQKALIGRALRGSGAYDRAIAWLEEARAAHPEDSEITLQLALAYLSAGAYDRGFELYSARWQTGELTRREVPFPEWQGEDLTGKTVLVMPEQGFGDAVVMMRFLPWLRERCAQVIVLAERPLLRLFSGLDGADAVVASLERGAPVDVFLYAMDLPRLGLRTPEDIPRPAFLAIPGDARARAERLVRPHAETFKVGVVWSGSVTYKGNAFRSFSHREFLPLTDIPGVQLFSLYKGPGLDAFRADGSDAFIIDTGSTDRDFADCAATMCEMDLVVTSDTATAHIAGSLGLPTWVVLHWDSFWIYTHSGETTPWYPGMRLFRQSEPMDWSGPFARVRAELEDLLAGGNG